jgi:hypothetical protein
LSITTYQTLYPEFGVIVKDLLDP